MPSPLHLLKDGLNAPPLFIAHGLGGGVIELSEVVKHFGNSRPIYGIQWPGLDDLEPPHESIDEMAACFLDAIVALQPEGPYLLAGVSVGGLIMLEVAILLSERGEKVALLALLDTYPHPRYWPVSCWIGMVLRRAKHHATALTEMPWRSAIPHLIKLSRAFFGHLRLRRGGSSLMFASVDMKISHRRRERAVQAWTNYRPRLYPGTITFLKAEIATRYPEDPRKVWNNVALKIDIHALPCDHIALITTHTEAVAACIERCIEDALTSTEYDAGQNRRPIMDRALS